MSLNNTFNQYKIDVVESEYDNANIDLANPNDDEIFYDDIAPVSTKSSIQPMGIDESDKKTGKLSFSVVIVFEIR